MIALLVVSMLGCKPNNNYQRDDFINDLTIKLNADGGYIKKLYDEKENLDEELDLKYCLYVLTNFIMLPEKIIALNDYEKHINYAKEFGLYNGEKLSSKISKNTADTLINQAINIKDNNFNPKNKINYKHEILTIDSKEIVDGKLFGKYDNSKYVSYDLNGKKIIKKLNKHDNYYLLEDFDLNELISNLDIEQSFEIDFNDSEIMAENDISFYKDENELEMISKNKHNHHFNIDGYDIGYSIKNNGISFSINNNKKNGIFYNEIDIYDFKAKIKLKSDNDNDYKYFVIDFKTAERVGFKKSKYKSIYGNFTKLKGEDFLNNIKSAFDYEKDVIEKIIPIMKIKTPIPNAPLVTLNINVNMYVYASGKAEIRFDTAHRIGFEQIDGNVRFISKFDKDIDFNIRASTGISLGLLFGINIINKRVSDIKVETGIKGQVLADINVFKENGEYYTVESDLPAEYVDSLAIGNKDIKVCSELSLFWILKLTFNSKGSLLNDFDITKTIDFFKDDHQVLKNKIIMEKFQVVDSCSVEKRLSKRKKENFINADKLEPFNYHKIIGLNEEQSLKMKYIPKEYKAVDLIYTSDDISVVSVSNQGIIKGEKSGTTIIRIKTKDNKYSTYINVFVKN